MNPHNDPVRPSSTQFDQFRASTNIASSRLCLFAPLPLGDFALKSEIPDCQGFVLFELCGLALKSEICAHLCRSVALIPLPVIPLPFPRLISGRNRPLADG